MSRHGAFIIGDQTPTYLDPVRDEIDRLRSELALVNDTLRHRTQAHQRVIDSLEELRATAAACTHCRHSQEPS